jgi:putative membrane protein
MMSISRALIALVGVEHLYILTLEMFLWRTRGLKVFGMTPEFAETTAVLAKNQGLYNGFLAAGLFWSLPSADFPARATFFLACVIVAGLYGGATANKRILLVQTMPAAVALAALWISLR